MISKLKRSGKLVFLLKYTLAWGICAGLIFLIFALNGKSFLWSPDGIYQHYSAMEYLSDFLHTIIFEHRIPGAFNFSIGQGNDMFTTLGCYDFFDPVTVFCALLFPLKTYRYTLKVFIKLYLIGLSFAYYCYETDHRDHSAVLAGAIAYTFSGSVMFTFAKHPILINWAYFFPFLLGAVEACQRRGKRAPLILAVFFNILTSFYTFYMNVILVIIYVLVFSIGRIIRERRRETIRGEAVGILKIGGIAMVGVMLSMFIFLPTVYAYSINPRTGSLTWDTGSLLLYTSEYYKKLIWSLFTPYTNSGNYTVNGLNAFTIISMVLLFMKKGKKELKALLGISFVMLCIPLIGRLMNGMSYACNRWNYAFVFYTSLAITQMITETIKPDTRIGILTCVIIILYTCLCFGLGAKHTNLYFRSTLISFIVLPILYFGLGKRHNGGISLLCVMLSAAAGIIITFHPLQGNQIKAYVDRDKIGLGLKTSEKAAPKIGEDFFRVEKSERVNNTQWYNDVYGSSVFYSLLPQYITEYYKRLDLATWSTACRFYGLDGRPGLMSIAGVKYYTEVAGKESFPPYGYQEIENDTKNYRVSENEYALPIGFTYDQWISQESCADLDGIDTEYAMLQGAITADPALEFMQSLPERYSQELKWEFLQADGAKPNLSEKKISSGHPAASWTLQTDVPEDTELYLIIDDIDLLPKKDYIIVSAIREDDYGHRVKKDGTVTMESYVRPVSRNNLVFDLGSGSAGMNRITLSFGEACKFSFSDIRVVAVPMEKYRENMAKLQEYTLQNVYVGDDLVTGNISLPEIRILQFSIPYSIGWKAFVDGALTPLVRSNFLYMALELPKGDHDICLEYHTPYMREGICISLVTMLLIAAYVVREKKKR